MDVRYSHPPENDHDGTLLHDHLEDVAYRVNYVVPENDTTPAGESLKDVVKTLAWVHDFGKATTYFQQYLDVLEGNPDSELFRYHSPIGAFAAYYALDAQGYETETCIAGFVAIGKHHGQLPDVAEYVYERAHRRSGITGGQQNHSEKIQTAIFEQIQDIDEHVPGLANDVFATATDGMGDWSSFKNGFIELLEEIDTAVGSTGTAPGVKEDALSDSCYGLVLQCWGSLILADKTSAADAPNRAKTYRAEKPSLRQLDEYVGKLEANVSASPDGTRTERLNHYRSQAREQVLDNASEFAENGGGVATLTLPTGLGKTLTGLSAATAIRDAIDADRIVYALPFTSIIDQVVDEVSEVFETDTTGRLLTAHHHLAETVIQDEKDHDAEKSDLSDDVGGVLAESWRAGMTVTTFVQLFESLAGPKNRQSMKLPALNNGVVVLDEPQSLPLNWWKLVPRLIEMLTEQYGATVIAMTATQPKLFDVDTELVDNTDTYFETTDRVSYLLDSSTERYLADQAAPKSYDSATTELIEAIDSGNSTLAVCNTIDSARELTERITDEKPSLVDVAEVYENVLEHAGTTEAVDPVDVAHKVDETNDVAVLHLSTRLRPVDRLALIETAKELTDRGHSLLAISTQLVEAGVDISFARVYRDLAPIDSIVQAAGRCNRSFERDEGQVTVWWLEAPGDQSKTPAEAVYNRNASLLPVVAETLHSVSGDENRLEESTVARDAVEEYYRRLHDDKNVGKDTFAGYVDGAKAEQLGELSLIDQQQSAEVLVTRTEAERELVNEVREAHEAYDFDRLRSRLNETKSLQISVPYYRSDSDIADAITDLPQLLEDEGIYELDVSHRPSYFDQTIGFVVPEGTVDHQFL
jgi:CRISPR-associated endonuclease Cas3-HD